MSDTTVRTNEQPTTTGAVPLLTRIVKVFDHNRFAFIALAVASILMANACIESTTQDPVTGEKVTRLELNQEAREYLAKREKARADLKVEAEALTQRMNMIQFEDQQTTEAFEDAYDDLDAQDAKKAQLLSFIQESVPGLLGPYSSIALGLIGTGLFGDNLRKDRKIRALKQT